MKYLARFGKVWKNKNTGETYGNEIEIREPDVIANYTQVSEKEAIASAKKSKREKPSPVFEAENTYQRRNEV